MGGHGALVTALRNPERWHSVSAFAPIANPSAVPWGEKAFSNYLGSDRTTWAEWDASVLMQKQTIASEILIDQGDADQFLEQQLHPTALAAATKQSGQKLNLRRHAGYDHSYWFIQTFIKDHIAHHARNML
jgi:S-formylglutathione hydrolase